MNTVSTFWNYIGLISLKLLKRQDTVYLEESTERGNSTRKIIFFDNFS